MAETGNGQDCFLPGVLLQTDEDTDILDGLGVTELMVNAFHGKVDKVHELLLEDHNRLFVRNSHGATALDYAVSNKQLKVVDIFLAHNADLNVLGTDGYNILHKSVLIGQLDKVKFCVELGVNIDYRSRENATALILATKRGQETIVNYLVNIECDVTVRDQEGYSALEHAFLNNHTNIQQKLEEAAQENNLTDTDSGQQLITAINNGDVDAIESLIAEHGEALVNCMDPNDNSTTAFQVACGTGEISVVECLKQHGANIHKRVVGGNTALVIAAVAGHAHIVEWLIQNGALVNYSNSQSATALFGAIAQHDMNTVETLVEGGALLNISCPMEDSGLWFSPVHVAAMNGSEGIVKYLLERGAYGEKASTIGTGLGIAAGAGNLECIRHFLDHNCDINKTQAEGYTPLMFAAAGNQLEAIRFLVEHGADVNVINGEGQTALQCAESEGNTEIVTFLMNLTLNQNNEQSAASGDSPLSVVSPSVEEQLLTICTGGCESYDKFISLINQGVNVNSQIEEGRTPLIIAVIHENVKCVLWLLKNNADINLQDTSGRTPLMHAVQEGHTNVVKILLYSKANVFLKDSTGRDVIRMAKESDQKELVDLIKNHGNRNRPDKLFRAVCDLDYDGCLELLQHSVDVNSSDSSGNTALSLCIASRNAVATQIAGLLCSKGADVEYPDSSGRTPIQQCITCGNGDIARILLRHGAQIKSYLPSLLVDTCMSPNVDIIKTLVKHTKDVSTNRALHYLEVTLKYATMNEQAEVVDYLLTELLPFKESCNICHTGTKVLLTSLNLLPENYHSVYKSIKRGDCRTITTALGNLSLSASNHVRTLILQNIDDFQSDEVKAGLKVALHSGNYEIASALVKWQAVILDGEVTQPLYILGFDG